MESLNNIDTPVDGSIDGSATESEDMSCFSKDPILQTIVNEFTSTKLQNLEVQSRNDKEDDGDDQFYSKAKKYWSHISPTVDGMLGGFGSISFCDIRASTQFLNDVFKIKPVPKRKQALDCGAGIGRVTKYLLIPVFEKVDMVEQDENFANQAKEFIGNTSHLGEIYNVGLQNFIPASQKYDIIWSQWVLGHLKDEDLVTFLSNCIDGLAKNGLIIIKENFSSTDDVEVDEKDSSVTRPIKLMKQLINKAGLRIIKIQKQENFPNGLFPVHMIAMKPVKK